MLCSNSITRLATALALPTGCEGGAPFPYRDLIVVTAFAVVLGTLVLQGLTLRPLMLCLRLEEDATVEHEVQLVRVETLRAGVEAATTCPGAGTAKLARYRYELQLRRAEKELANAVAGKNGGGIDGTATPPATAVDSDSHDADGYDADAAVVRTTAASAAPGGAPGRRDDLRHSVPAGQEELDWAQVLRAGQQTDGEA